MTKGYQSEPISDESRVIHMKQSDSRTPACGYPFDQSPVEAKMTIPFLGARMKEKDNLCEIGSTEARSDPLKRLQ